MTCSAVKTDSPIQHRPWGDGFIINFALGAAEAWQPPKARRIGWHKDGDFFRHFLDSPGTGIADYRCLVGHLSEKRWHLCRLRFGSTRCAASVCTSKGVATRGRFRYVDRKMQGLCGDNWKCGGCCSTTSVHFACRIPKPVGTRPLYHKSAGCP